MSRLHHFHLLTAQEIQNSPSRADNVPESMEARRRKLAAQHMRDVSFKFNMRITTWAIAVTFFNRFYARKSMKKNNTFIMACASLFLAGKVNDEPRSHERLANELLKAWFGRDNPQLHALMLETQQAQRANAGAQQQRPPLPTFWTDMYEGVLEAERALLYTVGFDFNVDIIHTWLARLLNRPRFKNMGLKENKVFQQTLISMANDVYHKDATLVLQYPTEKIALAAFYFVFKAAKAHKSKDIPVPGPGADGMPWYIEEGLSQAECVEITTRFTDRLYSNKDQKAAQRKAAAPAPSSITGAASTAMLGACESAAYSGGGPSLGAPGYQTGIVAAAARSELLSDTMGEHTSMARPLGSDGDAAGPAASGGLKRAAEGLPGGAPAGSEQPSKRARGGEAVAAGSNEVTSSAVHPSLVRTGSSNHQSPAAVRSGPAPVAAKPAAATPLAADSDKEEGELEEGELA